MGIAYIVKAFMSAEIELQESGIVGCAFATSSAPVLSRQIAIQRVRILSIATEQF